MLDAIIESCAGLDVHRRQVVCTVIRENEKKTREFATFHRDLEQLSSWLLQEQVELAVMESTGIYWKRLALRRASSMPVMSNRFRAERPTFVTVNGWLSLPDVDFCAPASYLHVILESFACLPAIAGSSPECFLLKKTDSTRCSTMQESDWVVW